MCLSTYPREWQSNTSVVIQENRSEVDPIETFPSLWWVSVPYWTALIQTTCMHRDPEFALRGLSDRNHTEFLELNKPKVAYRFGWDPGKGRVSS